MIKKRRQFSPEKKISESIDGKGHPLCLVSIDDKGFFTVSFNG